MSAAAAGAGVGRAIAPAKINPTLFVLGRRADGYHELDTTLLALELADEVEVRVAGPGIALELAGPALSDDIPADDRNLAVRAARLVLAWAHEAGAVGEDTGFALRIEKRIPSQAGLGGGSSDAVATALAAQAALGVELPRDRLRADLNRLGSDCAFFLDASETGFARCTGRGDRVDQLPALSHSWTVAIVTPDLRAPTPAVYAALELPANPSHPDAGSRAELLEPPLSRARQLLHNDLEAAAERAVPELRAWRTALDRAGASHFRLCGSGASFFGLFEDRGEADEITGLVLERALQSGNAARGSWRTSAAGHGVRLRSSPLL